MTSIAGFDHALILVGDLEDGNARMQRLGFRPTPKGVHSAHMGTANYTIMLPDMTYFEVIGVISPTASNQDMRDMLERREGLLGFAVKTDDAAVLNEELAPSGAVEGGVLEFSRPVDLPGGMTEASFSVVNFKREKTLGLRMFACTHHTPDAVWREDYLDQPNGVSGVAAVVGEVRDVDLAERAYGELFGDRVSRRGDEVSVDLGSATVSFLSGGELEKRFGLAPLGDTALRVLDLKAEDMDLARSELEANHVEFDDRDASRLTIAPHETCGAMIRFVSP